MSILKHLKNNNFRSDDTQEVQIKIEDYKLFAIPPQKEATGEDQGSQQATIDMSRFLVGGDTILRMIGEIITLNPAFVGSVLKHREQKTFKYIIRNILAIQYL